jgi:hypothetical protein
MAEVTYYVALPFGDSEEGPVALEAVECVSANAAITRAESLSRKEGRIGAVAFSRTADPGAGDFKDAVLLRKFGVIGDLLERFALTVSTACNSTARRMSRPTSQP